MRIIPVLDLKDGLVVHAVAGERSRYQPIRSVLVDSPEPLNVLTSLRTKLGSDEYYVADLNAIQGQGNHGHVIARLSTEPHIRLMVDAGCTTLQHVQAQVSLGVSRIVLGTETLPDWEMACRVLKEVSAERLILSLDMRAGQVLSQAQEISSLQPLQVLQMAVTAGFHCIIMLDLARVGVRQGLDFRLLARARQTYPQLELIAGGGVRNLDDVIALRKAGMSAVLIATALHRGDITAEQVSQLSAS